MKEAVPKRDSSFFFISEKTGVGVQFHELETVDRCHFVSFLILLWN